MKELRQGRRNLVLASIAATLSSAGSVLLQIIFATTIYQSTGSAKLTALFVSLQWLPVLAVVLFKSDWEDGKEPRSFWLKINVLSAIFTCPILLFLDGPNYVALFVILFIRGLFDYMDKVIRTVAVRDLFPEEKIASYAGIFQTGYHLGIALAAIAGILLGDYFEIKTVVILNIITFTVSVLLISMTKPLQKTILEKKENITSVMMRFRHYFFLISQNKKILFSATLPPLASVFFQGTYSVLQPVYPLVSLGLNADSVAISYVLASIAILGGSTFFAYINRRFDFFKGRYEKIVKIVFSLSCISSFAYILSVSTTNLWICSASFMVMIFTFEMIWMFGYTGMVAYSPEGELGTVYGISFCIGSCMVSLSVLLTGVLLDYFNSDFTSIVSLFMIGWMASLFCIYFIGVKVTQKFEAVESI